mmetsp:Transcript_24333/g.56576  ORF Transcript_24333/g.56576 Transcript_24333/m.56576 type:complete len:237 (+) Transcript_24333:446-1156(+)
MPDCDDASCCEYCACRSPWAIVSASDRPSWDKSAIEPPSAGKCRTPSSNSLAPSYTLSSIASARTGGVQMADWPRLSACEAASCVSRNQRQPKSFPSSPSSELRSIAGTGAAAICVFSSLKKEKCTRGVLFARSIFGIGTGVLSALLCSTSCENDDDVGSERRGRARSEREPGWSSSICSSKLLRLAKGVLVPESAGVGARSGSSGAAALLSIGGEEFESSESSKSKTWSSERVAE